MIFKVRLADGSIAYEYSPSMGPCATTSSRSARKVVAEARCHYFFHDLYYRTYFIKGKLRRGRIRLIKKEVKQYGYKRSPVISRTELRRLLNKYFSIIGMQHHPLTMVHARIASSPIKRQRPAPFHFPLTYMAMLRSPLAV